MNWRSSCCTPRSKQGPCQSLILLQLALFFGLAEAPLKFDQPGMYLLQRLDLAGHRLFFAGDGAAHHLPWQRPTPVFIKDRLHFLELDQKSVV